MSTLIVQSIPPDKNARCNPKIFAEKLALSCPNCGPMEYESNSMPARRPRNSSGIEVFHIKLLNNPLIVSPAPAIISPSNAIGNEFVKPTIAIPIPLGTDRQFNCEGSA